MIKNGLSKGFEEKYINKSNSLKIFTAQSYKKELQITEPNHINSKFKLFDSESMYEKNLKKDKIDKKLLKARNNILDIISNCMEKINYEINTEESEEIKKHYNKENKRKNNKQVKFNENNKNFYFKKNSKKSKNSLNYSSTNKVLNKYNSNIKHQFSNKLINENNNNITSKFNRIRTTSHLSKEKEKEIVSNISSSLIALYKPVNKFNLSNEKFKLLPFQQRRYSFGVYKFKKRKRTDSNGDKYNSALSNDSQILKKSLKPKKLSTFIKESNTKTKSKKSKNKSCFKNNFDSLLECKTDCNSGDNNLNKNLTKKTGKKFKNSKIEKINAFKWTNEFGGRENLTEGEYNHIEENLRQSLIGYEKTKLEEELEVIENTETTNLVKRLPTMKKRNSNSSRKSSLINLNANNISKSIIKLDKEKFRLLQHTGYVYDSLDDEEIEDAIDINHYYLHPDSFYIYFFDSIIVILSLFCLIYLPYYLAHDTFLNSSYINIKIFILHLIDIFYIIDLIISFFRAYYNYDEVLVKSISDISCHYFNNWFFLDFLSSIPFYSIIFFLEKKNINSTIKYNSLSFIGVKIFKMHYLLFLNKLLKIFKCFSENNRAFLKITNILFNNDIMEEKSGLFLIIFILITASNFGTCIFIFIGRNSFPSWMNAIKFEKNSFINIYICSLYYLIATITTVGYGDIHGSTIREIIFQIILLIIGTCTYSYLISSVSNYIKKINEKSLIFENKLKILNEIKITNPLMQEELYDKILRFLRYKKNNEKNKQKIIINSLPYSLRNLLIIEMYKPIINNFIIFKGLENSNCIVQLVTAFKPIFSIKNDILIQEGDFIEEVIFVKTGVISLEIGIDLNNPRESIIQYLNRNNEKEKSTSQSTFGILNGSYGTLSTNTSFLQNHKTTNRPEKKEKKNIHNLKVLDIRKNEHFGETLMFLNERSPLTAKVKSKKAELYFLKKEEVIKIFNSFPNIWNRINKKSIYNMKQIKITVSKVLLKFCSMIGLNINDYNQEKKRNSKISLLNNLNKSSKNKKISKRKNSSKKVEKANDKSHTREEIKQNSSGTNGDLKLSIIRSLHSLSQDKISDNENKQINKDDKMEKSFSKDLEKSNKKLISISKNNSIKYDTNPKSTQFSQNITNINHVGKNYYSIDINEAKIKNKINGFFSSFKNQKNHSSKNLLSEIENKSKEESNPSSSKETIKMQINKKIYSLIDSESIEEKKSNYLYEKLDINSEIYNNESFDLNCHFRDDLFQNKNDINKNINNLNLENLSKRILEKSWLNNMDKERANYLNKLLNKSDEKNILNKKSINSDIESKFNSSSCNSWILDVYKNDSFEIKALYENINEITGYKYSNDNYLRKKIKEILIKQCLYSNHKKISESKISSDLNFFKNLINDKKNISKNNDKVKKRELEKVNKSEIIQKRNTFKIKRRNNRSSLPNLRKLKNKHYSNNLLPNLQKEKGKNTRLLLKINNKQEKLNNSYRLNDEKEMSFYDKFNMSNFNVENIGDKSTLKKRKKQNDSELDEIKKIIKQEAQNLNEPSLYYQQLFLNQIQKRKACNQTFLPIKANNLKINNVRRISTSRETNKFNNHFGLYFKKNKQKSSVNIPSQLKK